MKKPRFDCDIKVLTTKDESPLFAAVKADVADILRLADGLEYPADGNAYVAGDPALEAVAAVNKIEREVFAELPVQAGWCFGNNRKMNGVEWHKSSEVVVACADCVLILGDVKDVKDDVYDTSRAVALHLERGEAVELRAGTLHLAPLPVDERFAAAIILPKGTNAPLRGGIDGTLRAVNKWLLVHPENEKGLLAGGKAGVKGRNITLTGYDNE